MPTEQTDFVMGVLLVLLVAFIAGILLISSAWAHGAPSGWAYAASCCSDRDCSQLQDGLVKVTPDGYRWDGELFPFTSTKIRLSGDEHYHGCKIADSYRPCLYVPAGGV